MDKINSLVDRCLSFLWDRELFIIIIPLFFILSPLLGALSYQFSDGSVCEVI